MDTDSKLFQANCWVIKQAEIGFEIKNAFKSRPHPDLLPQEKGQREGSSGLAV
jgi:hypothetical protein